MLRQYKSTNVYMFYTPCERVFQLPGPSPIAQEIPMGGNLFVPLYGSNNFQNPTDPLQPYFL